MIYRCSCGHRFVRNIDVMGQPPRVVWIDHTEGSDTLWHRVYACPTCHVMLNTVPPLPEAERLPFPD